MHPFRRPDGRGRRPAGRTSRTRAASPESGGHGGAVVQAVEDTLAGMLCMLGGELEGCQRNSLVELERVGIHFSPSPRKGRPFALREAIKCKGHCWPREGVTVVVGRPEEIEADGCK